MSEIDRTHARQILDSRGNPTVEVEVTLRSGAFGRASVPAGASTGTQEARELRDGGDAYLGKGVLKAVANVEGEIAEAIGGREAQDQAAIDERLIELDGTPEKSWLGANAILGVSLAVARAAAAEANMPLWRHLGGPQATLLPVPMMNVLNGGAHADNSVDFQEFMIVPAGASSFSEALRIGVEVYQPSSWRCTSGASARAWGTRVGSHRILTPTSRPSSCSLAAIDAAGYQPGGDVLLALDPATSELYRDGAYHLAGERRTLDQGELVAYWRDWCERFSDLSARGRYGRGRLAGLGDAHRAARQAVQLVGDDIFVTNPLLLQRGIDSHVANSILIKLNQIGTLTETLATIEMARAAGYRTVISHRSGETEDTTIADLAVATGAGQIKTGAPARSERVAKYNQLLRIEEELGEQARFPALFPPAA